MNQKKVLSTRKVEEIKILIDDIINCKGVFGELIETRIFDDCVSFIFKDIEYDDLTYLYVVIDSYKISMKYTDKNNYIARIKFDDYGKIRIIKDQKRGEDNRPSSTVLDKTYKIADDTLLTHIYKLFHHFRYDVFPTLHIP